MDTDALPGSCRRLAGTGPALVERDLLAAVHLSGSTGPRGRACRPICTCLRQVHGGTAALVRSTWFGQTIGPAGGCLFRSPVVLLSDLRCSPDDSTANSSRPDEGNLTSMPHFAGRLKSSRSRGPGATAPPRTSRAPPRATEHPRPPPRTRTRHRAPAFVTAHRLDHIQQVSGGDSRCGVEDCEPRLDHGPDSRFSRVATRSQCPGGDLSPDRRCPRCPHAHGCPQSGTGSGS